jgi:nucleotide-binding universal stress UspA family protein
MSRPAGEVVVGVDGTSAAVHVLQAALHTAVEWQAPVRVVRAWELPVDGPDGAPPPWHASVGALVEADTRAVVGEVVARSQRPVEVVVECLEGPAGPVLVEASLGARLVVVGGPRSGELRHDARSTGWYVLTHAHCPVEVVEVKADGWAEAPAAAGRGSRG